MKNRTLGIIYFFHKSLMQWRRQDFGSGGNILGGRPRRGSGGGAEPRGRQKISKISKKFLKKIAKMDYFRRFFQKIKNPRVKFSRFGRKTQLLGIFEKIFKSFLRK